MRGIFFTYNLTIESYFTDDIRLVGKHRDEGRVEVFRNGVWGTVCDTSYGENLPNAVCLYMGYSSGTIWTIQEYGLLALPPVIPISYHQRQCFTGDTLFQCRRDRNRSDCDHKSDIVVGCI